MYCRMLQGEHSAVLWTFIKLPFVIKICVLSIFDGTFEHSAILWTFIKLPFVIKIFVLSIFDGSFEHPNHMLKLIGKKIFTILC